MVQNWHFIIEDEDVNLFYCVLCGCNVSGYRCLGQHFRGRRHTQSVNENGDHITKNGESKYYCDLCECVISGYRNIYQHVQGNRHQNFLYGSESENSNYNEVHPLLYIVTESEDFYYCFICGCDISGTMNLSFHIIESDHRDNVEIYGDYMSFDFDQREYYCTLCECPLSSYLNFIRHIMANRHQNLMEEPEF